RISWRVPADFRAEVKSHVHPRKHLVPVINISAGGVLFRSANLFDMGETVEIQFTLPEGGAHQLTGQVVHITDANSSRDQAQLYGLRFIGQDPLVTAEIRAYVRRRVRALYFSGQEMHLRRRSDLLGAG
ncbi:MAG: PilZ domain-containing protein, partial [Candidatus Hydrogenedentes bacterium]|nr:PilZ domain-containing protein [Candidatus Hydrogenedentota bacterium]